jgi:vacuolar protein sorting-associated protein 26
VRDLSAPSDLVGTKSFPFEFRNVEMQYDSYKGMHARCR